MYLPTFYVNVRKYFKSIMNSVKSYFGKDFFNWWISSNNSSFKYGVLENQHFLPKFWNIWRFWKIGLECQKFGKFWQNLSTCPFSDIGVPNTFIKLILHVYLQFYSISHKFSLQKFVENLKNIYKPSGIG